MSFSSATESKSPDASGLTPYKFMNPEHQIEFFDYIDRFDEIIWAEPDAPDTPIASRTPKTFLSDGPVPAVPFHELLGALYVREEKVQFPGGFQPALKAYGLSDNTETAKRQTLANVCAVKLYLEMKSILNPSVLSPPYSFLGQFIQHSDAALLADVSEILRMRAFQVKEVDGISTSDIFYGLFHLIGSKLCEDGSLNEGKKQAMLGVLKAFIVKHIFFEEYSVHETIRTSQQILNPDYPYLCGSRITEDLRRTVEVNKGMELQNPAYVSTSVPTLGVRHAIYSDKGIFTKMRPDTLDVLDSKRAVALQRAAQKKEEADKRVAIQKATSSWMSKRGNLIRIVEKRGPQALTQEQVMGVFGEEAFRLIDARHAVSIRDIRSLLFPSNSLTDQQAKWNAWILEKVVTNFEDNEDISSYLGPILSQFGDYSFKSLSRIRAQLLEGLSQLNSESHEAPSEKGGKSYVPKARGHFTVFKEGSAFNLDALVMMLPQPAKNPAAFKLRKFIEAAQHYLNAPLKGGSSVTKNGQKYDCFNKEAMQKVMLKRSHIRTLLHSVIRGIVQGDLSGAYNALGLKPETHPEYFTENGYDQVLSYSVVSTQRYAEILKIIRSGFFSHRTVDVEKHCMAFLKALTTPASTEEFAFESSAVGASAPRGAHVQGLGYEGAGAGAGTGAGTGAGASVTLLD